MPQKQGRVRGIKKQQEEKLLVVKHVFIVLILEMVHCLDFGDGFSGAPLCQNLSKCTF